MLGSDAYTAGLESRPTGNPPIGNASCSLGFRAFFPVLEWCYSSDDGFSRFDGDSAYQEMDMAQKAISTHYKLVDGWHVFQSDELPGLYVASMDAERAFNDVGPSIELLMKLNHGVKLSARPELPFLDFLDSADKRFILSGAGA